MFGDETVSRLSDAISNVNPDIIFVMGGKDDGRAALSDLVAGFVEGCAIYRDVKFNNTREFERFIKDEVLRCYTTIVDGLEVESFNQLDADSSKMCHKDIIEGMCRFVGLKKMIIEIVKSDDGKEGFVESDFNENSYTVYNKI